MLNDWSRCPESDCGLPAEITDRVVVESTDGPVECVRTCCVLEHRFFIPIEHLSR